MPNLKKLRADTVALSVLYVEDNKALRTNASNLLSKFFDTVIIAQDGKVGMDKFLEFHPDIVITDIKMPNISGLELAANIKKISSETKIIIMSAFDDKDNLYKGIDIGISGFLAKPVAMSQFVEVLQKVIQEIQTQRNKVLFLTHIKSIFNYQSSMIMMLNIDKPIVVNQILLNFFNVKDLEEFIQNYTDLGNTFLEHDGFLYNTKERQWFDEVRVNEQKLYHTKIKNKNDEFKHFILKYQKIPDKDGYGVLSLNDITELNLLKLFNENKNNSYEKEQDSLSMFKLLQVIQENNAKVQLHNYYKGLSIMHEGGYRRYKG